MELVVEDAVLVTMAAGGGPGCMLVRDGRIAAVGPAVLYHTSLHAAGPAAGRAGPDLGL